MIQPKVVAFSGSARAESFNKKLLNVMVEKIQGNGMEVTRVDLHELALPIFDEDFESRHGLPAEAKKLKALLRSSDAFLIASPEYNSSFSPLLKNAIDWASRVETSDEPPLVAFSGKAALICAASPGRLGGLRGLVHLRALLGNLGVIVLPGQMTLPLAHQAFDESGQLRDSHAVKQVHSLTQGLLEFLKKHVQPSDAR